MSSIKPNRILACPLSHIFGNRSFRRFILKKVLRNGLTNFTHFECNFCEQLKPVNCSRCFAISPRTHANFKAALSVVWNGVCGCVSVCVCSLEGNIKPYHAFCFVYSQHLYRFSEKAAWSKYLKHRFKLCFIFPIRCAFIRIIDLFILHNMRICMN